MAPTNEETTGPYRFTNLDATFNNSTLALIEYVIKSRSKVQEKHIAFL